MSNTSGSENVVQTYMDTPSQPHLVLPPQSCDAHVHVFGPRAKFPFSPSRKSTPADAPKEKLFALHKRLGIERCVIVQSIVHGNDNAVVEDAIEAGGGNYLGVALTDVDVSDVELKRLASKGFRALRFHFMKHIAGAYDVHQVVKLTPRLADVGMHLQVHFESELIHSLAPVLLQSAVPVVIDHMGRVDATLGEGHADFQALMKMLEHHHVHVKVSGIDRIQATSHAGSGYPMGTQLAARLVANFPEQCVWGLDWPHPNHTHIPDDGELVDALAKIAPSPEALQRLLVTNPQALYRF